MIKGYIHIATMGNWKEIMQDQVETIYKSGLYSICSIDFCKVGPEQSSEQVWALEHPTLEEFEYPTLSYLYEYSSLNPGYSFYIHLKGVSKTPEHWAQHRQFYRDFAGLTQLESLVSTERRWRKYMEYFILEQHQRCIEALEYHDICGVQWREKPFPHFSGNFWWARNDYIQRLDHPLDFQLRHRDYRDEMGSNRAMAEFWIASNNPRVSILYNNSMNLYHESVPFHKYKNIPIY